MAAWHGLTGLGQTWARAETATQRPTQLTAAEWPNGELAAGWMAQATAADTEHGWARAAMAAGMGHVLTAAGALGLGAQVVARRQGGNGSGQQQSLEGIGSEQDSGGGQQET